MGDSRLNDKFPNDMAVIPRRGAVPEVSDRSKPFEICTHIMSITEADEDLSDGSLRTGISATKYIGDTDYFEKKIMGMIVKVIGNEILKNLDSFVEFDFVDPDSVRCGINNSLILVNIDHVRLRFDVVASIQARIFSNVLGEE
jgi:hypothetical protein